MILPVIFALLVLGGCASISNHSSGFLESYGQMKTNPKDSDRLVPERADWEKPPYTGVLIEPTVVRLAVEDQYDFTAEEMTECAGESDASAIRKALGNERKIVTGPAPGTLRVRSAIVAEPGYKESSVTPRARHLPDEGELPVFRGATQWLNSPPPTADGLRGKVVLVDFGTYSCINWLRTLPYVRAWAERYRAHGLVVVGVHSPEFPFEKNIENVRWAAQTLKVDFPIVIDNDHRVWRAFNNLYWPALYISDARGRIRHHHFGEGGYEQSERIIQQLLVEEGKDNISRELVSVEARGIEAAADWGNLSSPETYLGYERTERFVATQGVTRHSTSVGVPVLGLRRNEWTLAGEWTKRRQNVVLNRANGRIIYRFHARDLHLVMGPAVTGTDIRFRVLIDGKPPGAAHGIDTDEEGNGTAREQRLYQLIRQNAPILDRLFEIEFLDPGVEAFSFTFG